MQAELQAHLKNHGLNLALSPLLSVGVDAPQALRYIDDEVIECMQREHGLALVTAKILKAKLPMLLQWAARCPSYGGDLLAGSSVCTQNMHRFSAPCFTGVYEDSRAFGERARENGCSQEGSYRNAGVQNDAERVYAERGEDSGQRDALEKGESLAQEDAREKAAASGQEDAREEAAASGQEKAGALAQEDAREEAGASGQEDAQEEAAASGQEKAAALAQEDAREEAEGLAQEDARQEAEDLAQADDHERIGPENDGTANLFPNDVRQESVFAGDASVLRAQVSQQNTSAMHSDRKRVRFQCHKCLRWYLWSSPQTFQANKTKHLKYCTGLNTEAGTPVITHGESQSNKKNRRRAKATGAAKKSSLVTKARASLVGKTKTHRSVCSDRDLTSCAHSLLKMSREATVQAQESLSYENSIPMDIEESAQPFRFEHYVTQKENENCASIAEKFGVDAAGVLALNRTRYRGLKTERTKLKMGTNVIVSVRRWG